MSYYFEVLLSLKRAKSRRDYAKRRLVSSELWKSRGRILFHSIIEEDWVVNITARCAAKASHNITIKNITATKESRDPTEDTTFHFM